jgi:threonyl-tRNA synthetase
MLGKELDLLSIQGLIEHYGGAFPTWLAPEKIRVLPGSEQWSESARELGALLAAAGVRRVRRRGAGKKQDVMARDEFVETVAEEIRTRRSGESAAERRLRNNPHPVPIRE